MRNNAGAAHMRELSLKQITETVGSATSSRSSMGKRGQKGNTTMQNFTQDNASRVKSQERPSRFQNNHRVGQFSMPDVLEVGDSTPQLKGLILQQD
jgi:hypothetical protein